MIEKEEKEYCNEDTKAMLKMIDQRLKEALLSRALDTVNVYAKARKDLLESLLYEDRLRRSGKSDDSRNLLVYKTKELGKINKKIESQKQYEKLLNEHGSLAFLDPEDVLEWM